LNVPVTVGVPVIVMVWLLQEADTPAGSPLVAPIPVAPVVVKVISVIAVLIQTDGVGGAAVVVLVNTVMVPLAVIALHPPVKAME
jgi:hypothetical protein